MAYTIEYTHEAQRDFDYLGRAAESRVRRAVPRYLRDTPARRSNIRRPLDPNPLAAEWELRLDLLRVFYDIDDTVKRVLVLRVGEKQGNDLYLRGVLVEMRLP